MYHYFIFNVIIFIDKGVIMMALNIADSFTNEEEVPENLVDYFIENIHIRLIGHGVRTLSISQLNNFTVPTFLAVYYKSGSVEIQHGGNTTILKPGSFYLFRPHDVYSGKKVGLETISFVYTRFDITPFMERYNFGLCAIYSTDALFEGEKYRRFGILLNELVEDDAAKIGRAGILKQAIKLLIAQIIYDQPESDVVTLGNLKKGRESAVINRAFQYTAEHLSDPIRIEEILKAEKISKATLEKTFRGILSTTPQHALLRFKIERSMEMLQHNTPIKTIVKALGFSSVYHYSNTFKKITGIRPTEYRRKTVRN